MPAICCPNCQALVSDTATTCHSCGATLGKVYAAERRTRGILEGADLTRNLLIFLFMIYVYQCIAIGFDHSTGGGFFDLLTPKQKVLMAGGALFPVPPFHTEWWRLVTSMFVHLSPWHIIFNALALMTLMPRIIEAFGAARAVILFVATGLCASVVSLILEKGGGGASGAACGYIGALYIYGRYNPDSVGTSLKRMMLMWAIFIAIIGFMATSTQIAHINNEAHAAGFFSGIALARLLGWSETRMARFRNVLALACVALVVISWALTFFYFAGNLELIAKG